jgi:hypothetical protein
VRLSAESVLSFAALLAPFMLLKPGRVGGVR